MEPSDIKDKKRPPQTLQDSGGENSHEVETISVKTRGTCWQSQTCAHSHIIFLASERAIFLFCVSGLRGRTRGGVSYSLSGTCQRTRRLRAHLRHSNRHPGRRYS